MNYRSEIRVSELESELGIKKGFNTLKFELITYLLLVLFLVHS